METPCVGPKCIGPNCICKDLDHARREDAAGAREPISKEWCIAAAHREAVGELEWQITCLRTALENWGRHFEWCASRADAAHACDCGLAAALVVSHPTGTDQNTLLAALSTAERERSAFPLPTEVLAIRAARDFYHDHGPRDAVVPELDKYIARLREAFARVPSGRTPEDHG